VEDGSAPDTAIGTPAMPTLITPIHTRPTAIPPFWRSMSAAPIAVLAGVAMTVSLSACGQSDKPAQSAASMELKQAGADLKSAASETGAALNAEAQAAKPQLKELAVKTDLGAAKLAAATGDALDTAGHKADIAAHKAAADAREHAQNAQN
jgi:hypothetical protein